MLSPIAISLAFLAGLTISSTPASTHSYSELLTTEVIAPDSLIVGATVVKGSVFYVGLNNYLDLEVPNANAADLEVTSASELHTIRYESDNRYLVHCTRAGKMTINIRDKRTNEQAQIHVLVKRIADPVVKLGYHSSGTIKAAVFRAQVGLMAHIENMDVSGQCAMQSFELYYSTNGQDPIQLRQNGGRFTWGCTPSHRSCQGR